MHDRHTGAATACLLTLYHAFIKAVCYASHFRQVCKANLTVAAGQVVLSHTPFRELARDLAERPVLVAGRKQTPAVARHYGYEHAISTCELAEAFPHAVPVRLSVKGVAHSVVCVACPSCCDRINAHFQPEA